MMDNYETIEKYLKDELSEKEKDTFEERLQNDKSLRDEFILQKLEYDAIERLSLEELKGTFKNIQSTSKSKWKRIIGIGTIALIIGGIAYYTISRGREIDHPSSEIEKIETLPNFGDTIRSENSKPKESSHLQEATPQSAEDKTERLDTTPKINFINFAMIYFNEMSISTIRGDVSYTENDTLLISLGQNYQNKKYELVVERTNLIQKSNPRYLDLLYLRANSLFYSNEYLQAKEAFTYLFNDGSVFFKDKFDYELLLTQCALLPKGKKEFNDHINSISKNDDHTYQNEAIKLYSDLKESSFNFE